ncbi:hypothetical protein FB446DRAFT_796117, partial [Lentinula raphanica]
MIPEARRDILGMLLSQSGRIRQHNINALTIVAEKRRAFELKQSALRSSHSSSPTSDANPPPTHIFTPPTPAIENHSRRSEPPVSIVNAPNPANPMKRFGSVPLCFNGTLDTSWLPAKNGGNSTDTIALNSNGGDTQPLSTDTTARPKPRPLPCRDRISPPLSETADGTSAQRNEVVDGTVDVEMASSSMSSTQDALARNTLEDCPNWLIRAVQAFGGIDQESQVWRQALDAWVTLERSYEFDDPSGRNASFPTAKGVRPPLVEWYYKNRKNVQATLNNDFDGLTVEALAKDLRQWWSVINP